ncbi:PREDICTED: probable DNA gyrase subunit A, chloroplastic/mitochondrial isoform X1 [Brassica oleracea var. oleracea]|uniref:probable DNA gyrase subunit A, chloroplastic/mitochondrial isoform X1 n=1 Tax=Brassica oleracea var. oleracea TaxID=109376 RepID=UPI0006A6CFA6|nr:PREDICTED: probable DNA gyrase subunit A, chloroplastic/mitochondrial isoform X1 [Brassica oleracea var. oleracea]
MTPFCHSTVSIPNPNSLMSLSSTLRLSSSLLRRSLSHPRHFRFPLSDPLRRLRRTQPSGLRFISSLPPQSSNNGGLIISGDENSNGGGDPRIVPFELHKEATESYMSYALSVLLGRALPDVRDGLKPVHRRILFAMHELGMSSKKPYKKSARVVGEVLGKFHPHGDTAVYDSLVRMAQSFSLRCPLIQGHGNFGSIDADPAAAMRYTECRLDPLAEAVLLADLDQDTVDFVPNFDNSQKEPTVLPARLPALLLNGASGIAVGMATNIPPHNLGELVDVLCALIHNPEATLQELLEYMPAPDFPTGGTIMGNLGVLDAYRTGRGRVVVRGKTKVEMLDAKTKRNAVIITEIPYQTNKATLVQKIAELVENKILEGISDIRDESDRNGMRVVIELKRGGDPALVLNNLYRHTALQSSFSCNMVGICDGEPKLMGLKELLQAFIDFRCSVVERRERFKLSHAQKRKHIIEGIAVGLDNVEAVIQLIRKASSPSAALQSEYGLSEEQAEAILAISFRRLTALERKKFTDESSSLTEQITKLEQLLSSRTNILKLIEQEAIELKDRFSTPRRSVLEDSDSGDLDDIDVIPNEEMLMAISEKGYVKRMKPDTFNLQNRGTIGKSVGKLRVDDAMSDFLVCHAHDHVLFFSDRGIVYSTRAYKIPECSRNAAGTPLVQILSMSEGERVTSIVPVSEFSEDQYLLMLTVNGCIKKVPLKLFSGIRSTGIIAIQLNSGDELKWVRCCSSDDLVAMASQNGMVVLSTCDGVRTLSRNTKGVTAMRLKNADKMASMDIIPSSLRKDIEVKSEETSADRKQSTGPWLLFVCENGYGKRVPLSSFKPSRLNRVGLIGSKFAEDDRLTAVFVVGYSLAEDGESDEQVVLVSQTGTVNRIKVRDISIQSRRARGVILMRLDYAGKIQSASLISAADVEEEEGVQSLEESAASL